MIALSELLSFCDTRTRRTEITDFPGAENGLQLENNGTVTKIGAAVDAGLVPFQEAAARGIDFLIVHHGMYWTPNVPLTGRFYKRLKVAMDANLAVYGSHLPLDAHPEIGNNAILARRVGLSPIHRFLPYEGEPIGLLTAFDGSRDALRARLEKEFPAGITAIEFGSQQPERVALLTGSGRSALGHLKAQKADTLITGELRQEHFNLAQEEGFNLYCCGHYATEVFGVQALAAEAAEHFGLEWEFVPTSCPL